MTKSVIENVKHAARLHVSEAALRIGSESEFPWEIWRELGKAGLLGLSIPHGYGGSGVGARSLSEALHELVFIGGNLGLGLSVMIHSLVSGYVIAAFAPDEIKDMILPLMASGKTTCSFAVSEPGRGGHPKFIETRAIRETDLNGQVFFNVTGEKTYLTNGPIADYFIIIAVSGEPDGVRKRFSAFLADINKSGIERLPVMKIHFFRPSPHGGVKLEGYHAFAKDMIGIEGSAYDDIVIPFRDTENCFMAGPVSGAMRRIALETAKEASLLSSLPKEAAIILARLSAIADLSRHISGLMADAHESGTDSETIKNLYFQFREICTIFHSVLDEWESSESGKASGCGTQSILGILINDLRKSAGLGDFVLKTNLAKAGFRLVSMK